MENMTEKEFEELLKQQTEEIPVPDSLSPENMVKRIKMDRGNKWMKEGKMEKFDKKSNKLRKWMYRISASAAVFLCGGLIAYGGIYGYGKWKEDQL